MTTQVSELMERLREGKRRLRAQRVAMSNPEKVLQVIELQKATLPMIRRRRQLASWEGVWPLTEG
ncbi:MAG TPA: hypothetical protein VGJ88_10805 [Thermoanaerobaculia bacterium]|jgi:hypothetical protein